MGQVKSVAGKIFLPIEAFQYATGPRERAVKDDKDDHNEKDSHKI
jgi:hypothetical protein